MVSFACILSLPFLPFWRCLRCVFVGKSRFQYNFCSFFFSSSLYSSLCIECYWNTHPKKKWKIKLHSAASSSTPHTKIACTFVWFIQHHHCHLHQQHQQRFLPSILMHILHPDKHTHTSLCEVYQFIFFLWCIGNLIFSSIWKEKCSLYSLIVCASNTLSHSFSLTRFSSSRRCKFFLHFCFTSCLVSLSHFSSFCCSCLRYLLLFICRFPAKVTVLWLFLSHVCSIW